MILTKEKMDQKMVYSIDHQTHYKFSSEVFLEPHHLRFRLKTSPHIKLQFFELRIEPEPAGISEQLDAENNLIHLCWFEGMHRNLTIQSTMRVLAHDYNPFNFIISPSSFTEIPFSYSSPWKKLLIPSLHTEKIATPLLQYGKKIQSDSNNNTIDFLANLNRHIHEDFNLETRDTGTPYHPDTSFKLQSGSCRDLAWMEIHLLRQMGIAARFVSGYFYLEVDTPVFELHAWVEVFLPGAGWIGFDPSHGIIAGNSHIPVASSAHFENTMAVSGTIRGNASSELETDLEIQVIS